MVLGIYRTEMEKLQMQLARAKKERKSKNVIAEHATDKNNSTLSAQVERYKEVINSLAYFTRSAYHLYLEYLFQEIIPS